MSELRLSHRVENVRRLLRGVAAVFFIAAGINHFINPTFYRDIIPPAFPARELLVAVSGVCEIVGGIGLLIPPLRRAAGWGLIALLCVVFPANIYMVISPMRGHNLPPWMLWARLPLQGVFIAWVWFVAIPRSADRPNARVGEGRNKDE